MAPALRDAFFSPPALTAVPVPELGATVYMRPFTLAEMLELEPVQEDEKELTLGAVILGVRDQAGAPIFTRADAEQLLTSPNGHILQHLARTALRLGKIAAGESETTAKN